MREFTNGQMAEGMRVDGRRTSCMFGVCIPGLTAGSMTVSTMKIRSMDMESTCGPMARNTKATGEMESSMGKVDSLIRLARVVSEFGSTVSERSGFRAVPQKSKTLTCPSDKYSSEWKVKCERSFDDMHHKSQTDLRLRGKSNHPPVFLAILSS